MKSFLLKNKLSVKAKPKREEPVLPFYSIINSRVSAGTFELMPMLSPLNIAARKKEKTEKQNKAY